MQRRDPLHRMQRFLFSPEAHALCGVVWSDAQDRALHAQLEEDVRATVDTHLHLGDAAQQRRDGTGLIDRSPGLTIDCPATPQEFYDLGWAAASENPVLLFLPKLFYRDSSVRSPLRRRMPDKALEHFGARIAYVAPEHDSGGVTVVAFGRMILTALDAAQRAAQQGIPVEVLALRTLKLLPLDDIFHSVAKTKRLVTVEEAPVSGGFGEHLVANVTSDPTMLATLWATPRCVGAPAIDPPPVLCQLYSPGRGCAAGD